MAEPSQYGYFWGKARQSSYAGLRRFRLLVSRKNEIGRACFFLSNRDTSLTVVALGERRCKDKTCNLGRKRG